MTTQRQLTTKGELTLADQRQAINDTLSYWEYAVEQADLDGKPNPLARDMLKRWTAIKAEFAERHGL